MQRIARRTSRRCALHCSSVVLICLCVSGSLASTADAAFRGQNGRIAFVKADAERDSTIWDVQPSAKRARALTRKPRRCRRSESWTDEAPDYSPSGKRIVYRHSDDCGRGHRSEVRVVRADGSGARRLFNLPLDSFTGATFTADGNQISFDAPEPGSFGLSAVHFVDSGSGRPTRPPIPTSLAYGTSPEWASSGQLALSGRLAQEARSSEEIIVGDVGARQFRRITSAGGPRHTIFSGDTSPDWAPTGNRIVFTRWAQLCLPESSSAGPRARAADPPCESETEDRSDIYVVDAAGGRRARRLTRRRDAGSPVFSPQGTKIAFGSKEFIYVMSSRGGRARRVARGSEPDWQPLR